MKYLKLYEEFMVGDMVYINTYGPRTTSYSDGHATIRSRLPFRPQIITGFDKDTKYEIVHMDGDTATVFNDENEPVDISVSKLHYDKIDTDYVMDCVISSFEDMFEGGELDKKEFQDELIIQYKGKHVKLSEFDEIFFSEFKSRLFDEGYCCGRNISNILFDDYGDIPEYAGTIQIVVKRLLKINK